MALKAHAALGCRGVTRTDFRYDPRGGDDGELVCLEINTQPGMTPLSLVPEQAAAVGISYGELVEMLVHEALRVHAARASKGGRHGADQA